MATERELLAMRRAIVLAQTPGVPTGPNPRVGAVILGADGNVVGSGYHRGAGSPHAEVDALVDAGHAARGATAVVSLEPCDHHGRTGPCSQELVAAGVRRVVIAQPDQNPAAAGGADTLRAAGIDVEVGVLGDEAERVNHAWSFAMRHRRPFVTWKFATTLDGRSAAADGTARWITGPAARTDVHRLRARCDAVLVGTGTIVADNPRLTVRDGEDAPLPRNQQPLRVVMGTRDLDPGSAVFDDTAETLVVGTHDPAVVLGALFDSGRQHVWLEGGPTLATAFLRSGLVDEIVAYVAPALLGAGAPVVGDLGIGTVDAIERLDLLDASRVGDDVRLTLRRGSADVYRPGPAAHPPNRCQRPKDPA